MSSKVLIYTTVNSPRLDYVCSELFDEYELIGDPNAWLNSTLPKIWYSSSQPPGLGLHIKPTDAHQVWQQGQIPPVPTPVLRQFSGSSFAAESVPVIYLTDGHLGFDPFAAAFYMLSLAAEYGSDGYDQLGRYVGQDTLKRLYKNRLPVLDLWRLLIQEVLTNMYNQEVVLKATSYELNLSMDIDNWYAFKSKGLKKQLGGLARDLFKFGLTGAIKRITCWLGGSDPYDSVPLVKMAQPKTIFILNAATESSYNKNIRITSNHIAALIKVSNQAVLGLHQSYQDEPALAVWQTELNKLSELTSLSVSHSRYHYLKFRTPSGFRDSLKLGITNDHSLVFANGFGWRAGTSLPFRWYDLEQDQVTSLTVHPYVGMDTRLAERFKGNGKAAANWLIESYGKKLQKIGLPLPLVIHNESLGRYGAWRGFHEFLLKLISDLTKC